MNTNTNTNEKRDADADAMTFEEVRAGDRVRTRQVFSDGTVFESEFTVTYANSRYKYFGSTYATIHKEVSDRESLSIALVSRPTAPPKVGDLLTGAQVQALPDYAVFLGPNGVPRTVFEGKTYAPNSVGRPLSYHDFTYPAYRLIYLPEEEN